MAKVTTLRPSTAFTVDQAISSAAGEADRLDDVLIIGYDKDGELFVRSSRMDRKDALWLIKQAELHTLDIHA